MVRVSLVRYKSGLELDYVIAEQITPGDLVLVPLRNRQERALVISTRPYEKHLSTYKVHFVERKIVTLPPEFHSRLMTWRET